MYYKIERYINTLTFIFLTFFPYVIQESAIAMINKMCDLPSLRFLHYFMPFTVNSTSALLCVGTFSKRHTVGHYCCQCLRKARYTMATKLNSTRSTLLKVDRIGNSRLCRQCVHCRQVISKTHFRGRVALDKTCSNKRPSSSFYVNGDIYREDMHQKRLLYFRRQ